MKYMPLTLVLMMTLFVMSDWYPASAIEQGVCMFVIGISWVILINDAVGGYKRK